MRQMSEIDELFHRLMGYYPKKAGQAYEILSAAAIGLIKAQMAEHNQFLKGNSGGRAYQIDGLLNGDIMIESKDYTIENHKVGRPDLQKLEGTLTDLPQIKEGYFTSATDYSKDAIKYADGTETNDAQKVITTIDIRPSTPEDEQGRILTIFLTMHYLVPNYEKGKVSFIFPKEGQIIMEDCLRRSGLTEGKCCTGVLYDKDGNFKTTIADFSRNNQPVYDWNSEFVSGEFPINAFIKFYDVLVPIKGISYTDVPIEKRTEKFTIVANGNATLLIKSEKLGINKLISDVDLKKAISVMLNKTENDN